MSDDHHRDEDLRGRVGEPGDSALTLTCVALVVGDVIGEETTCDQPTARTFSIDLEPLTVVVGLCADHAELVENAIARHTGDAA